ncbi:MAG: protein GlmU [Desulfobacteraceae bacterium]|nr:protein GlmU [Desulfobacteraceae bacterium]
MKPFDHTIKEKLLAKGVAMPNPDSVYIADDVDPDRISGKGVTVFAGSKIVGKNTLILPGTTIGYEAPVTMENCLVGKNVRLNGGYFQEAVFLGDNVFGSNAHVRSGTILEEQAGAAHTVGLKQTILFPFVILGSLINFCDCFMAGGTSRKDHSEVGSSFVHFNYTPNQDKATASMMGNVHQGVMLDQHPIFLGGQGGLVGPVRIGFGCLTGAGTIVRKDEERPDRMILAGGTKSVSLPRRPGLHTGAVRIFNHNIQYISALISLSAWYAHVRPIFAKDALSKKLITGLQKNLAGCIHERIRQLEKFCDTLRASQAHDRILIKMESARKQFDANMDQNTLTSQGQTFVTRLTALAADDKKNYISVIQHLDDKTKSLGSEWLHGIETSLAEPLQI